MVLVIGNHLNGGSFRGAARGFKLNVLLKLMDVKGRQKNTTLLHFVVTELLKTDEQVRKYGLRYIDLLRIQLCILLCKYVLFKRKLVMHKKCR